MASSKHAASPEAAPHLSKAERKKQRAASREATSASPVLLAEPSSARPKASPKKRSKKANGVQAADDARAASKALIDVVDATPAAAVGEAAAALVADEAIKDTLDVVNGTIDGEDLPKANTARVTVTSDVTGDGDAETTRTSVKVELPPGSPEQPVPESPEQAIRQAKEIVEAVKEISQNEQPAKKSKKRKAAEAVELENPEEEIVEELVENASPVVNGTASPSAADAPAVEQPPTKRARVMVPAEEFRRQKMQKRALMGLSATVAVGAMIPFISNLF